MIKRTMPIKTTRIELDGEYKGWWVDIRTNPPVGLLLDALIAFQQARAEGAGGEDDAEPSEFSLATLMPPIYDMLTLTIKDWNFVDEQGADIPATLEGVKQIPLDLLMLLAATVQGAVVSLPLASSEPSPSPS